MFQSNRIRNFKNIWKIQILVYGYSVTDSCAGTAYFPGFQAYRTVATRIRIRGLRAVPGIPGILYTEVTDQNLEIWCNDISYGDQ